MTSPAPRRRSQFINTAIDDYAAVHSTPPDAHQLELQRITQEKTGVRRACKSAMTRRC